MNHILEYILGKNINTKEDFPDIGNKSSLPPNPPSTPKSNKKKIKNYFLLIDTSGSMCDIWNNVKNGVQAYFDEIKKSENSDNNTFTLIIFNTEVEIIYNKILLKNLEKIDLELYLPGGSTSLKDAIIIAFRNLLSDEEKNNDNYKVFFQNYTEEKYQIFSDGRKKNELYFATIFTDGIDNSSEFKSSDVKKLTKYFNEQECLDIVYLGTKVNVTKETHDLGIIYQRNLDETGDIKDLQRQFRGLASQQSGCDGQMYTCPELVEQYSQVQNYAFDLDNISSSKSCPSLNESINLPSDKDSDLPPNKNSRRKKRKFNNN